MRIKTLGIPYGQAGSVYNAIERSLQIEMRDILESSEFAEFKSDSTRRNKLGKSF